MGSIDENKRPGRVKAEASVTSEAGAERMREHPAAARLAPLIISSNGFEAEGLKSLGLEDRVFGYSEISDGLIRGRALCAVVTARSESRWLSHTEEFCREFLRRGAASATWVYLPNLPPDPKQWAKCGLGREDILTLVAGATAVELDPEEEDAAAKPPRPLQIAKLDEFSGLKYLERGTVPYNWLISDSLRRGQLGLVCGPPGSGKGMFCLQMACSLAAGQDIMDFWEVPATARILYISAEDDEVIINNRLYFSLNELPPEQQREAAGRLCAVPVHGRVNICVGDKSNGTIDTENLVDLDALVASWRPDLLILDTLARFLSVDENDNPAMTAACGRLEEIIARHGCNILLIHHSNKGGGDLVPDMKSMAGALSQTAIRGASALPGAIRWALMMVPLSDNLAVEIFGPEAKGEAAGRYLAARVAKKNAGRSEHICYLKRSDQHGLLHRAYPPEEMDKQAAALVDAHMLAHEVRRRMEAGEKPLSVSKGGREAFEWSSTRARTVSDLAIKEGLLIAVSARNGRVLSLPDFSPRPVQSIQSR